MDERDPNYDSDSLENGDVTLEAIVPHLTPEEINKHLEPTILEYYSHGVTKEVRGQTEQLINNATTWSFVNNAVIVSR